MHVFVTGASGWIGSATVAELLAAGHQVTGLARSDASASALRSRGAAVLRGDLDDLESLRAGASAADAVVHLANKHDWSDLAESNRAERAAVETIGEALAGTRRRFVVAAGVAGLVQGRPATEEDRVPWSGPDSPRGGTEQLALDLVEQGVGSVVVRFAPTVHGEGDHGFIASLVGTARARGVSGFVGDGSTGWSAVHRSDAARLVRLGVEQAPTGAVLQAVAEESVSTRMIAEAIGHGLDLPTASIPPADAAEHFGFLGALLAMDLTATSRATGELLGWTPTGPTLLDDLRSGSYLRS